MKLILIVFLAVASLSSALVVKDSAADEVVLNIALKPGAAPMPVRVKLHPDWAPIGVEQFKKLVSSGSLNAAAFFRVVPGFIVQFGLPATPGPKMQALQDDPVKVSNKRGTVVFATAGPNTRTNQLFINLGDNANLDKQGFSPIGEIMDDGMDAVDGINPEYGEKPEQGGVKAMGNKYLDQSFPNLSKIQTATMRAAGSSKEAQQLLGKTKANVKETLKTGKNIEGVAGDISKKYPKKQEEVSTGATGGLSSHQEEKKAAPTEVVRSNSEISADIVARATSGVSLLAAAFGVYGIFMVFAS